MDPLDELFAIIDSDNTGRIGANNIHSLLNRCGYKIGQKEIQTKLSAVFGTQSPSCSEFTKKLLQFSSVSPEKDDAPNKLLAALKDFTLPNGEQLPVKAIPHFVDHFGLDIPVARFQRIIEAIHVDEDECINVNEFVDFIMSNRSYIR